MVSCSKDVFVHYGAEPDVELGINSSANGTWTFFRLHMMTGNISCELYNPQKQTAFGWANDLIFGLDTKRIPAKVKYFQMFSNSAANLNLIAGETFGTNFETVPADGAGPHDRHLKGKQVDIYQYLHIAVLLRIQNPTTTVADINHLWRVHQTAICKEALLLGGRRSKQAPIWKVS